MPTNRRGKSPKRVPMAATLPRARKRTRGRTDSAETVLSLRHSGVDVSPELHDYVLQRLGWRLGKFARHVERLTVRFEDVNGPRGGVDTVCRIKVVLSGLPSVVVEERASDAAEAFNRADDRVERAVKHSLGRARGRGLLPARAARTAVVATAARAARRPSPKPRATVRNVRGRTRRATAAMEASARSRPSRKSTRGSVNRAKHGNKLARRESRRLSSPKARATRGR